MFQSFLSLFPVLLFDLNLGFHEHENGVVADAEVLSEGLLEEVVGGAHVASIAVDDGGENVSFNNRLIFGEAVSDLSDGASRVIVEPAGLGKEHLSLSQG